MKKIFTLIAAVLMAAGVQAETLISFPASSNGITVSGTCTTDVTVKIHENKDATAAIQFKNGYTTDGVINANYAELSVDGGFKAGDKIVLAGVFNNADDTKQAAVTLFTGNQGEAPTDLWTSELFINGRTSADDPAEQTFTLTEDCASLKMGRANGLTGATGTWVLTLKVVRGEESPVDPGEEPTPSGLLDYPVSLNGITVSGTCTTDVTVKIHENKDATAAIQFKNGYTSEGAINDNYTALAVDGGFKAGDVLTIAGVFNNADDTKQAAVTLFTGEKGEAPTDIWTSDLFINGRTQTADPTPQNYTLTADYASLKLGRANGLTGATGTWVTLLKVVRETAAGISQLLDVKVSDGAIYNLAGQKVGRDYKGVVVKNGKKMLNK